MKEKTWIEKEFPKAKLLNIEWLGFPKKLYFPFYTRLANCGQYHIWGIVITWRLPWLLLAAWNRGWDCKFRQDNEPRRSPVEQDPDESAYEEPREEG